jgi:hypothetical protein
MPKEQSFQTVVQMKEMYDRSLKPVELLDNQKFKRKREADPLEMTKTVLKFKGIGGSI